MPITLSSAIPWRSTTLFGLSVVALLLLHNSVVAVDLVCPSNGLTKSPNRLKAIDANGPNFEEVSGLALSPIQRGPSGDPILYTINDSGGGKRLGVYDSGSGERLLTLRIESLPSDLDWESLAIGSCGNVHGESFSCIYIGDVGDNLGGVDGTRSSRKGVPYRVYKIREPLWEDYQDNDNIPESETFVLEFDYCHPTSPTDYANVEAIFLDHTGGGKGGNPGDVYFVTKWLGSNTRSKTRLFKIPVSAWSLSGDDLPYSPEAVGNYEDKTGDLFGNTWTMADMTLDGTLIALGDYGKKYVFPRCPGFSVADALTGGTETCLQWKHPSFGFRFETFAWTPDGTKSLIVSERDLCDPRDPPLSWTTMDYADATEIINCPPPPEETEDTNVPTVAPKGVCPVSEAPTMAPSALPFPAAFEELKCDYYRCLNKFMTKFEYSPEGFGGNKLGNAKKKADAAVRTMGDAGDVVVSMYKLGQSMQWFQRYRTKAIKKEYDVGKGYANCVGNVASGCAVVFLGNAIQALEDESSELISEWVLVKATEILKEARKMQRGGEIKRATFKALRGVRLILDQLGDRFLGAPC